MSTDTKDNIVDIKIEEEMQTSYLDYAMSVIVGRALPDVRDGLKPVHRRALYTMQEMSNFWNRAYKKSARVVGEVMGKYHPHGDSAIYDTIVRLAQPFTMRYQLVDGQGNFGSVDGDSAAAMRYTEIRMMRMTNEILADIDKDTVDFVPNYDGSTREPTVLPSRVPNLLVNGSSGIAVGMATNIPPHNLTEVIDGLIEVINGRLEKREVTIDHLMTIVKGPDFPTAAFIVGRDGIRNAFKTGRGIIKMRAKVEIEEGKRDKEMIVITEIPYQVNKARFVEKVAMLVREKKIEGISDIRDESDRTGMRVVIECRKGENVEVIKNRLFKLTQLSDTFGVIMLALHNGQPKLMNLKEYFDAFTDHRRNVIVRRSQFDLKKAEARAHILEGLLKAIDVIDEIVALIKKSKNPDEARHGLVVQFKFSEIQAQAILDMRLQRLTGLERDKLEAELKELQKIIKYLQDLLGSAKLQLEKIIEESKEIREKYGDARRTEIIAAEEGDQNEEDLIADEEMIVTITNQGYIKRIPPDTYKAQRRGGMGIKGMTTNEEDFVSHLIAADTKTFMLVFSNLGKVYWLKVHQIPEGTRTSRGKTLASLLGLSNVEKVCSVMAVKNFEGAGTIVMATKAGVIKKTELSAFSNPRVGGIIALTVNPGDLLVNAIFSAGGNDLILCSKGGMSIRFSEEDVRAMGRGAAGVRGMDLEEGDEVVGLTVLDKTKKEDILSVTNSGYGKRTAAEEYRIQSRGGKGIITMKSSDKNGEIIAARAVSDSDDLMLITDKGQVVRIRIREISTMGRNTQGVRLVRVKEGEKVVACQSLAEMEDDSDSGDDKPDASTPPASETPQQ
jgi:DNA gyrase subunit A